LASDWPATAETWAIPGRGRAGLARLGD